MLGITQRPVVVDKMIVPPVRGVSVLAGFDLALAGSSTFVRELAPLTPYRVLIALGYDYDAEPPPAAALQAAEALPPPPAEPKKGRVIGQVTDQASGAGIGGVLVRVVGSELTSNVSTPSWENSIDAVSPAPPPPTISTGTSSRFMVRPSLLAGTVGPRAIPV